MMNLTQLRDFAKANLCPNCFGVYTTLLEPNIRPMVLNPLSDWREAELGITQMIMKHKGIFRSEKIFVSIGEDEESKFADEVDIVGFKKIEKWKFKRKIDYLRKNGILKERSYTFLDLVRNIRNKIHKEPILTKFSEKELNLFLGASAVVDRIHMVTMRDWGEPYSSTIRESAEELAETFLSKMKT